MGAGSNSFTGMQTVMMQWTFNCKKKEKRKVTFKVDNS